MFTTLKYRRHIAVLAVLAMVASVLVAAPAVAADPTPSYTATFSACVGDAAGSSDFEDVPAGHPNAGDINCIAYYGITMGTGDGSTYSPAMSVTREHMALFLIRLAKEVGIEVTSTPADAGFTDIRPSGSFGTFGTDEDVAFFRGFVDDWFFQPHVVAAAIHVGVATREQFDLWRTGIEEWGHDEGAVGALAFGEAIATSP